MQINRIDTTVPRKISRQGSGNNQNINNTSTQSFKGIGASLDSIALGTANLIENGGLAVSFTLQDMLGTNLPRPIMGLRRNSKENKGEKNLKFAAKEVVREMLTGPSMFLIPMGILAVGRKAAGKTVDTPMKFINDFGKIHAAMPNVDKQGFFKNTFTQIIQNAKFEESASKETIETATQFATRLLDISNIADKKVVKSKLSELSDDFVAIAKSHADDAAFTDFTIAKVSDKTADSFKDVSKHMMAYADDIVDKVCKKSNFSSQYIKNLADKKVLTRLGMNIGMYAAVIAFLRIIPKLYNKAEGEGNAGLKGLMKEETLNDKSLEKQTPAKDKSNPSFGSSVPKVVIDTVTGNGNKVLGKLAQWSEFSGPNVSFPFLLGLMGLGIFIPRLSEAKDKYDREEILRRDVVTCATMCFGEHELRKAFSKVNESSSGFVLADKGKGFKQQNIAKRFFDYIRPINGVNVLSSEQIASKYSNLHQYKDGLHGFCKFIDGQGGKLSKIFSLTDESKAIADRIVGGNIQNMDNASIMKSIKEKLGSDDVKDMMALFKPSQEVPIEKKSIFDKILKRTTKVVDNPWVKKAKTLNARFTALSVLVIVPLFLGFMLPAINERATKKRISKEQAAELENQKNTQLNMNTNFFAQDKNVSKVFSDIANFTK